MFCKRSEIKIAIDWWFGPFTKVQMHIPERKHEVYTSYGWQSFTNSEGIFLATYAEKELGLMVIVRAESTIKAVHSIMQNNPNKKLYHKKFNHSNGNFIEYDLDAPKDTWVIKRVND